MNESIFSISSISQLSNIIQKWKSDINNIDVIRDFSCINWKIIEESNDKILEDFINDFSDILIVLSLKSDQSQQIIELMIENLKSEYAKNNIIRKVFVLILWKLYNCNPLLKENFEITINHMFPYYMHDEATIITYITSLLELITPLNDKTRSKWPEMQQFEDTFIKDMRSFILMELTGFILDCDSSLIKSDLQKNVLQRSVENNEMISKLDNILSLMLSWMKNICYKDNQLNWPATESLYKCMRTVYIKCLLPCSLPDSVFHSHYIFAYLTSFHPSLAKNLCEHLYALAINNKETAIIRSKAASNLCAFIAKFNFITVELLIDFLTRIFDWCRKYVHKFIVSDCAAEKHSIFYDLCNGGFYVFLHRHKEIIAHFGSIFAFCNYANVWELPNLIRHPAVILKQYPFREQFPDLRKMMRRCRMGSIDDILKRKVYRKERKKSALEAMPFRYFFLSNSANYIIPFRLEVHPHESIN